MPKRQIMQVGKGSAVRLVRLENVTFTPKNAGFWVETKKFQEHVGTFEYVKISA
jgi:hypothetical protein